MLSLVVGGAASGKSAFAERLLSASPASSYLYLATMFPCDEESRRRVVRHRAQRAALGCVTVERPLDVGGIFIEPNTAALLDGIGTLAANELFDPAGAGKGAPRAIVDGVLSLAGRCRDLVVVSDEVFSGGSGYAGDTWRYLEVLAQVNIELAQAADAVYEVCAGCPARRKGPSECER